MDRPQPVSAALERDLANLRGLNRWFGAWRILRRVLEPEFAAAGREGRPLRIVDLCSGSGDLPLLMVRLGGRHGADVRVQAVEGHAATFEIGRRFCAGEPAVEFVRMDVREWGREEPPEPGTAPDSVAGGKRGETVPAGAEPPDWVVCSLALHHFTAAEAVGILRRMRATARRGVLAADLERVWWAAAGIYAASPFYREPMTREDMRRSARAAFSRTELREMAREAGWRDFRQERFWYGRQAVWESLGST